MNGSVRTGECAMLISFGQDNSFFRTMFTLPQGNNDIEGRSDDNPIVLTGDTVPEFRHFLWALYAL
jgi:hypothetical protein